MITWLNRGTLHLVAQRGLSLAARAQRRRPCSPLAPGACAGGRHAGAAERGVAAIARALADDGPLDRAQLRERIAAAGVPPRVRRSCTCSLLARCAARSCAGRCTAPSTRTCSCATGSGERPRRWTRERALAELARRYLAGHGAGGGSRPGAVVGLAAARRARGPAARSPLSSRRRGRPARAGARRSRAPRRALPPPRLLGAFDPLLLGWRSREELLDVHHRADRHRQRHLPAVRARGGTRDGDVDALGGELELQPFARMKRSDERALQADAQDVVRFLRLSA